MPMSSSGTCKPFLRQRPQLAAAEAGAAEGRQAVAVGPLHRAQDVGTVARAADGDEQVAGAGQVLQLLHEDAVEALVVAPGEDVRRVVGQAEDAETLFRVVVEVLAAQRSLADVLAEMRGVRAAAAVADQEDEAVALVTRIHEVRQGFDFGGIDAEQFLGDPFQKRQGVELGSEHVQSSGGG